VCRDKTYLHSPHSLLLLNHYIKQFSKLKRATVNGNKAPYKPVLILSIIQLIENKEINENKVFITLELVATFKDIWSMMVRNPKFTPTSLYHFITSNQISFGIYILIPAEKYCSLLPTLSKALHICKKLFGMPRLMRSYFLANEQ
jgi:hypothetical protein